MILNLGSIIFNAETLSGGGTPAWGTEMGQGDGYRFNFEDCQEMMTSLVYTSIINQQNRVTCPLGKGGNQSSDYEFVIASLYEKVYVNGEKVNDKKFVLLVIKKLVGNNHVGRRTLKYNPRITLDGVEYNSQCYQAIATKLGVSNNGSWFISQIDVKNQDELHFTAHILDSQNPYTFKDSSDRSSTLISKIRAYAESRDENSLKRYINELENANKRHEHLLPALRTKPFLLLAGISGTGKSRIVKQMAFDTCQNIDDLQKDKTSPGNYQLIEVKPNWHDSTEVLGYESEIGGKHYVTTPFVKFLVKAMLYEDKVPFFVCMDEMNLAPVEQYFAEFLSVLESRKLIDERITSESLIPADVFKEYEYKGLKAELSGRTEERGNGYEGANLTEEEEEYGNFNIIYDRLKKEGLRIPSNLIVVGTVNMDETTHQFSRKVIDRAMTIEMNIADGTEPFADFFNNDAELDYRTEPLDKDLFLPKVVQAKEALGEIAKLNASDVDYLKAKIPALLSNLNEALNGTPFKIAYRVQNELVIYFFELRREEKNKDATAETLLIQAMDAILMQKVLPRVEGDEDLLEKPLEKLHAFTQNYENAHAKVEEMQARLNAHFTSFWP